MEDEPGKVLKFRKKRSSKPVHWKVTYEVRKNPKRRVSKDKVIFWIKFVLYIAMVSYVLRQCDNFASF